MICISIVHIVALIAKRGILQIDNVTRYIAFPQHSLLHAVSNSKSVKEGLTLSGFGVLPKILNTCETMCIHSTCNLFQPILCRSTVKRFFT